MGRGDSRTAKGKRFKGSFGKSRRRKKSKNGKSPAAASKGVKK